MTSTFGEALLATGRWPVALLSRPFGEMLTALFCLMAASIEKKGRDLADWPPQIVKIATYAPLAILQPTPQSQYRRGVTWRANGLDDRGMRGCTTASRYRGKAFEFARLVQGGARWLQ